MLSESQKYEKVWENDAYREWAPGQDFARKLLSVAKPFPDSTIVDYGAGTGRGAANIRNLSGCSVTMLDFAPNCLDQKVRDMLGEGFRFVQHDLALPTIYDPCSNVAVEALGCGCPVVTTDANGAKEFIVPGENGAVLTQPDDIPALAQALSRVLEGGLDPRVRQAAAQAVAHLDWDVTVSRTLTVLAEAAT